MQRGYRERITHSPLEILHVIFPILLLTWKALAASCPKAGAWCQLVRFLLRLEGAGELWSMADEVTRGWSLSNPHSPGLPECTHISPVLEKGDTHKILHYQVVAEMGYQLQHTPVLLPTCNPGHIPWFQRLHSDSPCIQLNPAWWSVAVAWIPTRMTKWLVLVFHPFTFTRC